MDCFDFCLWLGLSREAAAFCASFPVTNDEAERAYEALCTNRAAFFASVDAFDDAPARYLALYVRFAQLTQQEYARRDIPEAVFRATLSDIALWEQQYFDAHGVHGIDEERWLAHHICLDLFQLGSLQFEPTGERPDGVPQDTTALPAFYVHIPKGADISPAAASCACAQALQFWKLEKALFLCHSWLLSPVVHSLLPEGSRIVQFGTLFQVASLDFESRQAEERIFGAVCESAAQYPARTSLQKTARAHLLGGSALPSAIGFRLVEQAAQAQSSCDK